MQYGRGFFAPLPFERIDIVTGNVFLSFTDLSLPGNAGLDLNIVRTYNSRDGRWRIGLAGVPLRVEYNVSDLSDVDFITADGAKHNAAGGAAVTLTQGFWQFTKATRTLEMPNGLVLTYGHEPSTAGAYLTEIRDPFDNVITLTWLSGWGMLQTITQSLGSGQVRTVTFANWQDDMATSMSFGGRTWTYTWQTVTGTPTVQALTSVAVPGGTRWAFTYENDSQNAVKVKKITTPNGGTVTYTWLLQDFPTTPSQRVAIKTRVTGGRAPAGTWNFNWQDTGRMLQIEGPVNIVRYWTVVVDGIPVKSEKTVYGLGMAEFEKETLTYESLPHPIAPVPAIKTVTLVRDTSTYTTTYTYATSDWANYGQPTQIVQVGTPRSSGGALTRTTNITYQHGFSKYIRGRVASVTTTVDGLASTRTFTYNSATGFMTQSSDLGVTTTYNADARGNVEHVWDPSSRRQDYYYQWGVLSGSNSPNSTVTVSRDINADGTVAWEEATGLARTTYGYDAAGRVKSVSSATPGRVPVTTSDGMSGADWVSTTTTRGAVSSTATLDGFGRTTATVDSAGVRTRTVYNAGGQVTYQSHPYGSGVADAGNTYTYDALGRSKDTTRPDGSWVTLHYGPASIGVQESTGPSTYRGNTQHYHWFTPGDGRMWRLVDAALGDWRYMYNGRGQLIDTMKQGDVTVPGRSWGYDAQGRMTGMTQPESGTSTWQYNAVGNVTYTQDARGAALSGTTYSYDSDHRMTFVNAPGTADDVTTTYDASGRVATVTNPTQQTTLAYDTSSRVTARTDVISGRTFVQTFVYDGYDNLIQVNYPLTGRKVFYDYNTQQRLTGVRTQISSGPVTTLATNFVYRGDGALASYQYGNGLVFSNTQDSRKRPATLINGPLNLSYTYDHVSNVKTITDPRPGMSAQFTYDALDRMTAITGFGATTFDYTGGGDRTREGTINFHYDANRRLSSLSGGASGSFSYDAIGSLLSDPSGAAYTYTALNMLKTSTLGGQTTTYQYGGGGMRAVKTGPDGVPRLYVYGAGGGPIGEYKVSGGAVLVEREYVYLGSQLLASFAPSPITPPPLSVAIATPASGAKVPRAQVVHLTATVSLAPGLTVSRVEYYNGGTFIGQATSGTFAVSMSTDVLPATNVVVARVVATNGQAASSSPVTITVQ